MKNEILDDVFFEDFRTPLLPDEKVIWKGKPLKNYSKNSLTGRVVGTFVIFLLTIIFIILFPKLFYFFIALFLTVIFVPEITKRRKKENTKYVITDQRIFFHFSSYGKLKEFSIPFSEIKNIVTPLVSKNIGAIHLALKDPNKTPFKTYDLATGEPRHQPTLEMIDELESVANIIRKGIQGKL